MAELDDQEDVVEMADLVEALVLVVLQKDVVILLQQLLLKGMMVEFLLLVKVAAEVEQQPLELMPLFQELLVMEEMEQQVILQDHV